MKLSVAKGTEHQLTLFLEQLNLVSLAPALLSSHLATCAALAGLGSHEKLREKFGLATVHEADALYEAVSFETQFRTRSFATRITGHAEISGHQHYLIRSATSTSDGKRAQSSVKHRFKDFKELHSEILPALAP